ncbi:hypothetical protein [Flavobacterium sp.]|uniref:hypothetical protein n=1 Tax=Flavobacterium sp. TaxID=239 RepID=UPI0026026B19|nr:hypothetical protein [Flavobacterium sp.]
MKKILIPILIVAFFVAFWNQNNEQPNLYITIISVIVFMFGMMKLSAKVPPKNDDNDN